MTPFIMMATALLMNLIMIYSSHPIAMGLTLMLQALLISLIMGTLNMSFWFSYVLFLIFLGGLLVLFIYVASLASNEMFFFSQKLTILLLSIMLLLMITMTFMDFSIFPNVIANTETLQIFKEMNNLTTSSISKFYCSTVSPSTVMLIIYLFLTLIVAVKITKLFYGPLRKMN